MYLLILEEDLDTDGTPAQLNPTTDYKETVAGMDDSDFELDKLFGQSILHVFHSMVYTAKHA